MGSGRHDRFVYGHLPFTGGLIASGAAFEHLAVHADEPTGTAGVILGIGLSACVAVITVITAGTTRSWRMTWPWPVVAVPATAALAILHVSPLSLAIVTAAVVAAVAVLGTVTRRVRIVS